MKKNYIMRAASALLVAALLTTTIISGTFAKYITSDDNLDTSRVAKWGVEVELGTDLFAKQYVTDEDGKVFEFSVISSTDDNVVAPGTKGTFANTELTGKPEVATRITQTHAFDLTGDWVDADGNFYCPIIIKASYSRMPFIGAGTFNGLDYASEAEFEAAVNALSGSLVTNNKANADLSKQILIRTWSWSWAFEGTAGAAINQSDVDDTYLGDIAAGLIEGKTTPNMSFESNITITQID